MANSLLAYLYPHIRGSQEDIATLSLQYICSVSDDLTLAFNKLLLKSLHKDEPTDLHFICQSVGDKKERPDVSMQSARKNCYVKPNFMQDLHQINQILI